MAGEKDFGGTRFLTFAGKRQSYIFTFNDSVSGLLIELLPSPIAMLIAPKRFSSIVIAFPKKTLSYY